MTEEWFASLRIILVAVISVVATRQTSLALTLSDLQSTVVLLVSDPAHRDKSLVGTGFFVARNGLYLVTAEHVARPLTKDSAATIRTEGDKPLAVPLGQLTGKGPVTWEYHGEADVAVLGLDPQSEFAQKHL